MLLIRNNNGVMVARIYGEMEKSILCSNCYKPSNGFLLVVEDVKITIQSPESKIDFFLWEGYRLYKEQ